MFEADHSGAAPDQRDFLTLTIGIPDTIDASHLIRSQLHLVHGGDRPDLRLGLP